MQIGSSAHDAFHALRTSALRLQPSSADTSATVAQGYDFTHMTRGQMRESMNDLIRSGKMSLDEASALVPMAGPSQTSSVDGAADATYDSASVNFIAMLQDAIAWAQSRNDRQGAQSDIDSLAALQRHQKVGLQK